jgi:putative acetyltransferase
MGVTGTDPHRSRRPSVRLARSRKDVEIARALFREYRQWHVEHQSANRISDAAFSTGLGYLDNEIAGLPGEYALAHGAIVLAFEGATPLGCGALREIRAGVGEIKRVYVRDRARGSGTGRRIVRALIRRAWTFGFERAVLDTLPAMSAAIRLYRNLGFVETEAYWDHPVQGALFFELRRVGPAYRSGPAR